MLFTPVQDFLVVCLDPETEESDGGIFIPEENRVRSVWGTVLANGPGRVSKKGAFIPTTLGPDDRVCIPWKSGQDLFADGAEWKIVRESDVMAIEDNGKTR